MNHALNLRQPPLSLRQPLAQNASANSLDVMMMKSALGVLGHYEAPEWGVTQFPDAALYSAIANFQKSAGLTADGVMKPEGPTEDTLRATLTNHQSATALHITAQSLQDLGRNGDEILAHITPAEAQLLHRVTDGASINPKTGLLEFWYDYEADAAGVGDTASNTGPDKDYGKDNDNGPTTKKNGQGTSTSAQTTATTPLTSTPTTVPDQTPQQARPVTVPNDVPGMSQHLLDKKDDVKAPPSTPIDYEFEASAPMRKAALDKQKAIDAGEEPIDPLSSRFTPTPPIPASKASFLGTTQAKHQWAKFNGFLDLTPGLSPQERKFMQDTYIQEGGMAKNTDSSAVAGILQGTLTNLIKGGYTNLTNPDTKPSDLTVKQVTEIYQNYLDDAFYALEGSQTLKRIQDEEAASVLADTLFSHGAPSGSEILQKAINAVSPGASSGVVGSGTLAAYNALASSTNTKNDLLNALADARWEFVKSNDDVTINEWPGWKSRIDRYRP